MPIQGIPLYSPLYVVGRGAKCGLTGRVSSRDIGGPPIAASWSRCPGSGSRLPGHRYVTPSVYPMGVTWCGQSCVGPCAAQAFPFGVLGAVFGAVVVAVVVGHADGDGDESV